MTGELPQANWKERILYWLDRRRAFLVEGDSMTPTLKDGNVVLINPNAKIKAGDLVLANHPYKTSVKILKRVSEIGPDGNLALIGDNAAASTDSRTFGVVSIKSIIGKVVCELK